MEPSKSAERKAKSYVIGRKIFLFHNTIKGAEASAIIYSLVETAKMNKLNIYQYLYTLLLYMPDYKNEPEGIEELMPWSEFIRVRCSSVEYDDSVSAYYSDADVPNFESLKDLLCQKCLDKVAEFYNEQMEDGEESHIGATGFALIDFQTKELYRLSDPYRGYMIRDYYIPYNLREKTT